MNAYCLLEEILKEKTLTEVADLLNLHVGTVKRWVEKKAVPHNYFSDLNSLLGNKYEEEITYRSKDQFFTSPEIANYCFEKAKSIASKLCESLDKYTFIEPSAGGCDFYRLLPEGRRIGIDICPPDNEFKNEIIESDYLKYFPCKGKKYFVIGNPPFGLRGNLALRFINHSEEFADFVAFILPPLFDSTGKGVPMKRVKGYKLVHTEKLPLDSYLYPDGTRVSIATIFQVWTKFGNKNLAEINDIDISDYIKIYSLSNGGTPSSMRNVKMIGHCDMYLPSTCFSGMKAYSDFNKLPNRRGYGLVVLKDKERILPQLFAIDWSEVAFLSTNSAVNLRKDLIIKEIIKRGIVKEKTHAKKC